MRWVGHGKRRYYTASMCVCVIRESLRVLGVLLATRLVLGVLLARHGRRELRGNTKHARYELSPCPCPCWIWIWSGEGSACTSRELWSGSCKS
jgi:hypothetical protein